MRLALLSDIHSNLEALEAVLEDARDRGVHRYTCLGDLVGYGANPNECIELHALIAQDQFHFREPRCRGNLAQFTVYHEQSGRRCDPLDHGSSDG